MLASSRWTVAFFQESRGVEAGDTERYDKKLTVTYGGGCRRVEGNIERSIKRLKQLEREETSIKL